MYKKSIPRHVREIEEKVTANLKLVKKPTNELLETQQLYCDEILEVYRQAFQTLVGSAVTYSDILKDIKSAYENAIISRNERIAQFIVQDKVFGITARKKERDEKIQILLKENEDLMEQNYCLKSEITKLKNKLGKMQGEGFRDFLTLQQERDARYSLYFESVELRARLRQLDGSACDVDALHGDPVLLRMALDRCREQLSTTQRQLKCMTDEYAETVPRREHDELAGRHCDVSAELHALRAEHRTLQDAHDKLVASKKHVQEELSEVKERCSELERAGTPRPHWELCADFIGGGRDRWWQLAKGLSSRETLRVLLKELGPAAESDHLEHFDGLGMDPAIPPYLRFEGRVRNLRLSRREVRVIINDVWLGKLQHPDLPMQDYVTSYFEDRYQQASVRAEWAYNVCAGAEQMLDEPQVKLFWGVLHGQLCERIYWSLRRQWLRLKENLYRHAKDRESITVEEFEKVVKASFPLKSEVDLKNLTDVVRRQLKLKVNCNEIHLDKLFQENEEGFDRLELARELHRQRQLAQDKYLREVVSELGARGPGATQRPVTVDALKRAFAIVDPHIDHICMERYIRWAFSAPTADLGGVAPIPLRAVATRLAAGDIERVGPRTRGSYAHRRPLHK